MALPVLGAIAAKIFGSKILGSIATNVGSSLLSNLLGSSFSRGNSKALMNHQQLLQQRQQQWLWQHQYAGQVAGMRMAGLNPAMSAGQSPPMTASMPSATNTNYTPIDPSAISQLAQLPSQIKINEETAKNIAEDTRNKAQDTHNKGIQGELMSNELFTFFQTWQADMAIKGAQYGNITQNTSNLEKQNILADKEIEVKEKTVQQIMETVNNLIETRNQIKASTAYIYSQKKGQDLQNRRYDELTDGIIANYKANSTYMSNEDQRQGALIIKRLVSLDIQNENAVWQQEYLKTLKDAQEWANYLDRVYGTGDRFLHQVETAVGTAATGYSMFSDKTPPLLRKDRSYNTDGSYSDWYHYGN